jgi:intracellular proteinase inhibitor BsuPI
MPIGLMNTRLALSIFAAGAVAFACGPSSTADIPSAAFASAVPMRALPVARHARGSKHDDAPAAIQSQLGVKVRPDGVEFELRVANEGHKQVELTFPSGQAYDFIVLDPVGREVWRWSHGRLFTQVMQDKLLGAGDDMRLVETWSAHAHGRYTAVARLESSNYPQEQRADFILP